MLGWSSIPLSPSNLTLTNTLPVGQSFLWRRGPLDQFSRAVNNPPRVVYLRQTPTELLYTALYPDPRDAEIDQATGITRRWIYDYFQLDRYPDLEVMYADWAERDPKLFGKVEASGVRVLRQDPWECLLAFITSTNNHIPRITSLMNRLCTHFSPPLIDDYHLFPSPDLLPEKLESTLRELGFGYRAGFIESTLASLRNTLGSSPGAIEAGLESWRLHDLDTVRSNLIALKGVGRKVADCVMLMCLDQPSLIPIDTHVAAIAARHPSFPSRLKNKPMSKALYEETQAFLLDKWGPLGGWCQAVMFAADLPKRPSPDSPASSLLLTPKEEFDRSSVFSVLQQDSKIEVEVKKEEVESPLKGRGKRLATSLPGKRTRVKIVADSLPFVDIK